MIEVPDVMKTWGDRSVAPEIQEICASIRQDESEITELENEISLFNDIDNDDLSNEERDELNLLNSRVRSTKYI